MPFNATQYHSAYVREKYDTITLRLPKGEKQKWQEAATKAGMSLNAFIIDSVSANMENDYRPERTAPSIPSVPTHSDPDDKEALYAERSRQMDELAAQFSIITMGFPMKKTKIISRLSRESMLPRRRVESRSTLRRLPICVPLRPQHSRRKKTKTANLSRGRSLINGIIQR